MDAGVHGDAAPRPVGAARRARPVQDTSAGRAVRRHGVDGSLPSDPRRHRLHRRRYRRVDDRRSSQEIREIRVEVRRGRCVTNGYQRNV